MCPIKPHSGEAIVQDSNELLKNEIKALELDLEEEKRDETGALREVCLHQDLSKIWEERKQRLGGKIFDADGKLLTDPNDENIQFIALTLNDLTKINSRCGHEVGDAMLEGLVDQLEEMVRQVDSPEVSSIIENASIYRMRGPDFMIALPNTLDAEAVSQLVNSINSLEITGDSDGAIVSSCVSAASMSLVEAISMSNSLNEDSSSEQEAEKSTFNILLRSVNLHKEIIKSEKVVGEFCTKMQSGVPEGDLKKEYDQFLSPIMGFAGYSDYTDFKAFVSGLNGMNIAATLSRRAVVKQEMQESIIAPSLDRQISSLSLHYALGKQANDYLTGDDAVSVLDENDSYEKPETIEVQSEIAETKSKQQVDDFKETVNGVVRVLQKIHYREELGADDIASLEKVLTYNQGQAYEDGLMVEEVPDGLKIFDPESSLTEDFQSLVEAIRSSDTVDNGKLNLYMQYFKDKRDLVDYRFDSMTGFPTRHRFIQDEEGWITDALEQYQNFNLAFVDLGFLKYFNRVGGRAIGDAAISESAVTLEYLTELLNHEFQIPAKVYRYAGDEFVLLFGSGEIKTQDGTVTSEELLRESIHQMRDNSIEILKENVPESYVPERIQIDAGICSVTEAVSSLYQEKGTLEDHGGFVKDVRLRLNRLADENLNEEKAISRLQFIVERFLALEDGEEMIIQEGNGQLSPEAHHFMQLYHFSNKALRGASLQKVQEAALKSQEIGQQQETETDDEYEERKRKTWQRIYGEMTPAS